MTDKPWYRQLWFQIVLGLALGIAYGVTAAALGWSEFTSDYIAPFGDLFFNGLQLIAVPLVVASLIIGVASLSDMRKVSRIGGKTIALYLATTAISVTIGLTYVNVFEPGENVPPGLREELAAEYAEAAASREGQAAAMEERGPLTFLTDIVPSNAVSSTSNNRNMLQVVFLALLFGIALLRIPKDKGAPLLAFFKGLEAVVIEFVGIVMRMAPLGVFALIARAITGMAGDDPDQVVQLLGALGFYCLVVIAGLATQMFVVYPLIMKFFTPLRWRRIVPAAAQVQLVAFSTSSSGATLPVTMDRAQRDFGVSEEVSSFVLPLGATINMDGTALYQAVAALFIAQSLGMSIGIEGQLSIVVTAVLVSIGTAAVPGAGIIMLVIILQAIGVPAAGVALILGVDRVLDMLRTATNVTGDLTVASVVAASEGQLHPPER